MNKTEEILIHALQSTPNDELSGVIEKVSSLLVVRALQITGGNQVQAAKLLGINRNTLRNRRAKG